MISMRSIRPLPPAPLPPPLEDDAECREAKQREWQEFYFRDALQDFVNVWWRRLLRRLRGEPTWIHDDEMAAWTRTRTRRKYDW